MNPIPRRHLGCAGEGQAGEGAPVMICIRCEHSPASRGSDSCERTEQCGDCNGAGCLDCFYGERVCCDGVCCYLCEDCGEELIDGACECWDREP